MRVLTHKLTDEELVRLQLETGNSTYFEQLYKRYFQKVYYQVKSYMKEPEATQDLTQDIFVKLHDRLGKFQEKSTFSTWIFSFVRNAVLDHLRKEKKLIETDLDEARYVEADDIGDNEFLKMRADRLALILEKIPSDDKAILIMMYAHGWQMDEISEVMNISVSAVKMRLKRAKVKVKDLYDTHFPNE